MSYTNISPEDLKRIIEYKDLFIKEKQLITQDEWLEHQDDEEFLGEEESEDESLDELEDALDDKVSIDEDEEFIDEEEESIFEIPSKDDIREPSISFPSEYEAYKAECVKYSLHPLSLMREIGKIKQLNLNCLFLKDLHITIILNHLLDYNLLHFTHLNFSKNYLSPRACQFLSEYITNSMVLSHLTMQDCWIGPTGIDILSESIADSISLKYINLSKCDLNDEGGVMICQAMRTNNVCKTLDLSYNKLSSQTAVELELLLKENQILEEVNLKWNELYPEKESIVKVLKGLEKNQSVRKLDLSWNALTGKQFIKFLTRVMKKNSTLQILNLANNLLKDEDIDGLLKSIPKSVSLRELYLSGNPLSRTDVFKLLSLFELSSSLTTLDLGKEFWHTDEFLKKAKQLKESHPHDNLVYQDIRIRRDPEAVNMRQLVIDRVNFVSNKAMANKSKKKRWDFSDLMHDYIDIIKKNEDPVLKKDEFREAVKVKKYKLEKQTIEHLIQEFPRSVASDGKKKRKPIVKVDATEMSQYYLSRFKIPSRVIVETKKSKKKKKDDNEKK